ncbi:MAG: ABC transporter ATP-binding protein [Actinobacteria bacterium]|nr:ABC transporter ATP-binding protein [Actinomycetota bacterium]
MTRLLELEDVHVQFHRRGGPPVRAVAGATLAVERGQIVGLVGESGCGKSTLARTACGLIAPSAGSIRFEGAPVTPLGRRARPRNETRLQMVFQNPFSSLNPRRAVGSQIGDSLEILEGLTGAAREQRLAELFELVGLAPGAARRFPHEFSGGQRQRIAIARALAARPTVIVLDEPLSALDTSAQAQIANLLASLARDLELGLLLISHDLAIVRQISHAVSVMYLGVVVESASKTAIWDDARHPYTQALIASIPRVDGAGVLPASLPGEVPDPARPPAGCRFHPRCPVVLDRCRTDVPPTTDLAEGHAAACWHLPARPGDA